MTPLPVLSCDDCGMCCTRVSAPPGAYPVLAVLPSRLWPQWVVDSHDLTLWRRVPEAARRELAAYCPAIVSPSGTVRHVEQPCLWLDRETKKCRWYDHRPEVCRRFRMGGPECLAMRGATA